MLSYVLQNIRPHHLNGLAVMSHSLLTELRFNPLEEKRGFVIPGGYMYSLLKC